MDGEPLTVDLDDDVHWRDRLIGILERLLQSDFINSEQAQWDVERLIDAIKATRKK